MSEVILTAPSSSVWLCRARIPVNEWSISRSAGTLFPVLHIPQYNASGTRKDQGTRRGIAKNGK